MNRFTNENPIETGQKTILNYGRPGTGKTTALGTLPKCARPIILLDFDRKSDVLHNIPGLEAGDLVVYRFDDFETVGSVNPQRKPALYKELEACLNNLHIADPEAKTIVFDSATTLTTGVLMQAMDHFRRKAFDKPEWDDYHVTLNLITKMVVAIKSTGRNVIVNAHQDTTTDRTTGEQWGAPSLYGKLATIIPGHLQELVRSKVRRGRNNQREYIWETKAGSLFDARTTLDLPEEIEQDYAVFWRKQDEIQVHE